MTRQQQFDQIDVFIFNLHFAIFHKHLSIINLILALPSENFFSKGTPFKTMIFWILSVCQGIVRQVDNVP